MYLEASERSLRSPILYKLVVLQMLSFTHRVALSTDHSNLTKCRTCTATLHVSLLPLELFASARHILCLSLTVVRRLLPSCGSMRCCCGQSLRSSKHLCARTSRGFQRRFSDLRPECDPVHLFYRHSLGGSSGLCASSQFNAKALASTRRPTNLNVCFRLLAVSSIHPNSHISDQSSVICKLIFRSSSSCFSRLQQLVGPSLLGPCGVPATAPWVSPPPNLLRKASVERR